jgi:hypothetical protein
MKTNPKLGLKPETRVIDEPEFRVEPEIGVDKWGLLDSTVIND